MSINRKIWTSVLCLLVVLVVATAGGAAHEEEHETEDNNTTDGDGDAAQELLSVRDATDEYKNVSVAEAEGYQPVSECVEVPEVGAMGIHYLRMDLLGDGELNTTQPEGLLYAPAENGELRLVGVEYVTSTEVWHETHDVETPTLFGQEFDGPMRGHAEGEPVHYDLHVWLWEVNPNGVFSQFNPFVTC